ncbi:MAG: SDR family oxidoreductase [Acidobacteria bacterium]|nr:SDR family oxidoreductase [Acidobacteriota bacterium]
MSGAPANLWALILGASSGFGEATAAELARVGMNIFGVHLDRKATQPHVEEVMGRIRAHGREAVFFNANAADAEKRKEILDLVEAKLKESSPPGLVRVLFHSLAFGTLKPYVSSPTAEGVTQQQMEMTVDVMGHSLVYWAQDLVARGLLREGGRIFAMTSSGGSRVIPAYGPVSAAKAVLESHIRQLAMELAPKGITANAIRAGVTDTPALRKIPGNELLLEGARRKNPHRRLTTPADVAAAVGVLVHPNTYWMTGNVIGVDGGEDIVEVS